MSAKYFFATFNFEEEELYDSLLSRLIMIFFVWFSFYTKSRSLFLKVKKLIWFLKQKLFLI